MKQIATLVARLMLIAGLIGSSPIHSLFAQDSVHTDAPATAEFRVMTWNIWHGGREDGEEVGPLRVAEVIRDSQADVVAMQETYGSGERIAEERNEVRQWLAHARLQEARAADLALAAASRRNAASVPIVAAGVVPPGAGAGSGEDGR